jgi:exodeoxyribonuclease-5
MTTLTSEQRYVADHVLRRCEHERQTRIGGLAGTGKTTLLKVLADELPGWQATAVTGKACDVLRRKGLDASTLHSLIYHPLRQPDSSAAFVLKSTARITCRGFLVDEASMVSSDLYQDLWSFRLPILFIGDHGQLPPVGSEINLMNDPDYTLEEIHRNAGPIAFFAEHLRNGRSPWKFEAADEIKVLDAADLDDDTLVSVDQVIVGFNKTRVAINNKIRRLLGRQHLPEVGDRVICLRNTSAAGLFNGQQGIVENIDMNNNKMDFYSHGELYQDVRYDPDVIGTEKPEIDYDPEAPHPFEYAYAITCHKAQGSEWDQVLVLEEHCPYWEPIRWNYTAASRATHRLYCVPERARKSTVRLSAR